MKNKVKCGFKKKKSKIINHDGWGWEKSQIKKKSAHKISSHT
jgi:hypothetical protein